MAEGPLGDIIGANYAALADKRLDELLLAGTHDSGAYQLLPAGTLPAGPAWQRALCAAVQSVAAPCAAPWVLTQTTGVQGQLEAGVRFLDMRISLAAAEATATAGAAAPQHITPASSAMLRGTAGMVPVVGEGGCEERKALRQSCCSLVALQLSGAAGHGARQQTAGGCTFLVTHLAACATFGAVLSDLRSFLEAHEMEVVVVRLCADWDHRESLGEAQGDAAVAQARVALGNLLYAQHGAGSAGTAVAVAQHGCRQVQQAPRRRPNHPGVGCAAGVDSQARSTQRQQLPSVREMVESGGRVALFVELPCSPGPAPGVFVHAGLQPYWADDPTPTGTLQRLAELIRTDAEARRTHQRLRFAAMAVTPTAGSVAAGALAWMGGMPFGLEPLAAQTNALVPRLLQGDLEGLMAVSLDFPSESVVRQIMSVNMGGAGGVRKGVGAQLGA
ncbi:hypothetical protein FOA52_000833 [Chlamydomonas sp. UWO 241]|nr:hypothetical protein FOA52_000833 [Chlamydomonas sp. UWO 241]